MDSSVRTSRLLLREWRDEDADPFAAMSFDPAVTEYLLPFPDRAASDAWIERMRRHHEEHGFAYWAVELPGLSSLIGAVGLSWVRGLPVPFAPTVEIGWRLARKYWGQGYAFEAAGAALDDGFDRIQLEEIVAFTAPANWRSLRLMARLGMSCDPRGEFDHPAVPEGHPLRRHVLYRIHRPKRPQPALVSS